MTDPSLLERLNRMTRVAPNDTATQKQSPKPWAWTSSERKTLTTEQKIYAISHGVVVDDDVWMPTEGKKKWKEIVRKCLKKCPWGVPWMIVVVSSVQLLFNTFNSSDPTYQLLAFSSNHKSEIWRFLTYSLLHAGTTHLIINIILQIFISLPLETENGHSRTLFVYLGGIFGGSLAASFSNDGLLMVGASSGIYSLLMSHLSHVFLNRKEISHRIHRVVFVAVLTLSDVVHSLSHCLLNNNEEPKIHIAAHVSGAICGLSLGLIFYYRPKCDKTNTNDDDDDDGADYFYRKISIACYLTFVLVAFVFNVVR